MKEDFTTPEVLKLTDVKKERLQVWVERKFIEPTIKKGSGPGSRRKWSLIDVYAIKLFKELLDLGLNRNFAGVCVKGLRERSVSILETPTTSSMDRWWLLVWKIGSRYSANFVRGREDAELRIDRAIGDYMILINVRRIVIEMKGKIKELGS